MRLNARRIKGGRAEIRECTRITFDTSHYILRWNPGPGFKYEYRLFPSLAEARKQALKLERETREFLKEKGK